MKPLLRGVLLAVLLGSMSAVRADWVVQVAALADSTFLRKMAVSIQKAGFPVTTEPLAQEHGPALTRLLSGPYETKAEAEAAAVRLAGFGWPGYVKQRTEGRLPARRPTPTPALSKKSQAVAPTPALTKGPAPEAFVPTVLVPPGPTPSPPSPPSRPTPSLQPARSAEPPASSGR